MTTREKVQAIYLDKKNWVMKPPSIRSIAKKLGVATGTVFMYIKELDKDSKSVS